MNGFHSHFSFLFFFSNLRKNGGFPLFLYFLFQFHFNIFFLPFSPNLKISNFPKNSEKIEKKTMKKQTHITKASKRGFYACSTKMFVFIPPKKREQKKENHEKERQNDFSPLSNPPTFLPSFFRRRRRKKRKKKEKQKKRNFPTHFLPFFRLFGSFEFLFSVFGFGSFGSGLKTQIDCLEFINMSHRYHERVAASTEYSHVPDAVKRGFSFFFCCCSFFLLGLHRMSFLFDSFY